VQFHPEFTSRPNRPQPLFKHFVQASMQVSVKEQQHALK
jgi:CTP synthase